MDALEELIDRINTMDERTKPINLTDVTNEIKHGKRAY